MRDGFKAGDKDVIREREKVWVVDVSSPITMEVRWLGCGAARVNSEREV